MKSKVKKIVVAATAIVALAFIVWTSAPMHAAPVADAAALYKAKCASCHGADGTANTAAGKKLGTRDFHAADVKGQSDAALLNVTLKGKNKMPGYEKSLGADQCKALVAYIRATFMK
ncbi:MAG TPA: cytochrome c [Blastocatellia bacterium]|jgi:mono/diheme cytochrome c family protein